MDEARLAEIEARANAATPGPWMAGEHGPSRFIVTADDGDVGVGAVTREVFEIYDGCAPWRFGDAPIPESLFIAHARTDVPALVAEVRRLRAEVVAARIEGAEAVRDAAMSVADDLAGGTPEASDCEWAHELTERVATAVARVRAKGGE